MKHLLLFLFAAFLFGCTQEDEIDTKNTPADTQVSIGQFSSPLVEQYHVNGHYVVNLIIPNDTFSFETSNDVAGVYLIPQSSAQTHNVLNTKGKKDSKFSGYIEVLESHKPLFKINVKYKNANETVKIKGVTNQKTEELGDHYLRIGQQYFNFSQNTQISKQKKKTPNEVVYESIDFNNESKFGSPENNYENISSSIHIKLEPKNYSQIDKNKTIEGVYKNEEYEISIEQVINGEHIMYRGDIGDIIIHKNGEIYSTSFFGTLTTFERDRNSSSDLLHYKPIGTTEIEFYFKGKKY